jgi:hypothetical protein
LKTPTKQASNGNAARRSHIHMPAPSTHPRNAQCRAITHFLKFSVCAIVARQLALSLETQNASFAEREPLAWFVERTVANCRQFAGFLSTGFLKSGERCWYWLQFWIYLAIKSVDNRSCA